MGSCQVADRQKGHSIGMIGSMNISKTVSSAITLVWIALVGVLAISLLAGWMVQVAETIAAEEETAVAPKTTLPTFGYGFNVAQWETDRIQAIGFNWMKVFDPPGSKQPVNVLLRLDANASHIGNVSAFAANIEAIAQTHGANIDAYEIGNEPNLDATYGWGYGSTKVPPNASDYVTLLCAAYPKIKAADPTAVVVSAGLAPTGRVSGNWNGHPGHNGLFQDEREFFKEFVAAGGSACSDAIGYHPYGYSADYDTAPDTPWGSPDASNPKLNCRNGFCFRGAESFYGVMQDLGVDKKMWATEFGWLTQPPDNCLSSADWMSRQWQIVSEQAQAENLVGAYQYAVANYPWMEAMFIFNLNFNTAPWITDTCEQMRFYGIAGRLAETALTEMAKVEPKGELSLSPQSWTAVIEVGEQPITKSANIALNNSGSAPLTYTIAIEPGSPLSLTLVTAQTAVLPPGDSDTMTINVSADSLPSMQVYTGTVTIAAQGANLNDSQAVELTLFVFEELFINHMPLIKR